MISGTMDRNLLNRQQRSNSLLPSIHWPEAASAAAASDELLAHISIRNNKATLSHFDSRPIKGYAPVTNMVRFFGIYYFTITIL